MRMTTHTAAIGDHCRSAAAAISANRPCAPLRSPRAPPRISTDAPINERPAPGVLDWPHVRPVFVVISGQLEERRIENRSIRNGGGRPAWPRPDILRKAVVSPEHAIPHEGLPDIETGKDPLRFV